MEFYYDEMETPVGLLFLLARGNNLLRIDYEAAVDFDSFIRKWITKNYSINQVNLKPANLEHIKDELNRYFTGDLKQFQLNFELIGTDFQKSVWKTLYNEVPYGETVTYKQLAAAAGNPKAIRAAGGAVNRNPLAIVIPCHRVIGSNGKLVGYNGGIEKKQYLLELEQTE